MSHTKAIARISFAHAAMFPVQRWLGMVAASLLVVGVIFPSQLGWGWLTAFCFLVAVVLPSGWIFCALSATETSRLLPYFRLRMLAAAVLLIAVVSVLCGELFVDAWFAFSAPRPLLRPQFAMFAITTATVVSMWFWAGFFWPYSFIAVMLIAVSYRLSVSLGYAAPTDSPASLNIPHAWSLGQAAWPLAAFWAAFSLWYLAAGAPSARRRSASVQTP